MALKFLLYNENTLNLLILKGIAKDKNNPSLEELESVQILEYLYNGTEIKEVNLFELENPSSEILKEVQIFFKQILQERVNSGLIAINLSKKENC